MVSANSKFDPILVEVVKHELAAITEEMAIAVWKTGRSAMVRIGDFATALCDARGRLIGQGYAAPFQLGFFMEAMRHFLDKFEGHVGPGDVVIMNDPYAGITHLPDVLIVSPAYWNEELVGYTLAYSHHTDIGGRFPGGFSSQCTVSYEEGIRLPTLKLYEGGVRNDVLMETILANVRLPEEWVGDIEAKVAGCWRGEQELRALHDKYGKETVQSCCDYLINFSEQAMRKAIAAIPDGRYTYEEIFEDDGLGTADVALPVQLTLVIHDDELTVDFDGTAGQAGGAINLPISMTKAAVYGVIKSILDPDVLTNVGFERPLQVFAPAGSLVNPTYPAAVGGRAPLFFRVMDMLYRALAMAQPERTPIPGEGGDVLHFTGERSDGSPFALLDIFFGGWGGRPHQDGIDGVAPMAFGSYGTIPAEILEREFPIVVDGFGYVPDTAGAGAYRGSLSIFKKWRFRAPGHAMVRTNRLHRPSGGMAGGGEGALSRNVMHRGGKEEPLPNQAHMHLEVNPGDAIFHVIAGSGGHGDALDREPERVAADVRDEKVSVRGAAEDYGVVIDPDTLTVDNARTTVLRDERRARR